MVNWFIMASQDVSDWDKPLKTSSATSEFEEDPDYCSPDNQQKRQDENVALLQSYVRRMAYQPAVPPKTKAYDVSLSKPKRVVLTDNLAQFKEFYDPKLRAKRIKRLLGNNSITTE